MKRFLLLFLLGTITSFAQQVKTQKDILQIPNTHLVKDFQLKSTGAIKPTKVIKSTFVDVGFGFENKSFNYLEKDYSTRTLTFEGNNLKSSINEFSNAFGKPNAFLFYYSYDNGVLKSSLSKTSNAGKLDSNEEKTEYLFFNNGLIKESQFLGKTTTTHKYSYQNNKLSYDFANGTTTYQLKNGLVTKSVTFNKSANQNYTTTFKYNNEGFLIYEDRGNSEYSIELNASNLIEKEIQKAYTKYYKYVYDKHGNWIIAYSLSKGSSGLYGSRFSFYIRQIKYSNGDVTGGTTPEDTSIKESLLQVRQQLYDELINGKKQFVAKKIRNIDLEFPLHEIEEDYGLKIKGTIVPLQLKKKQYDQRAKRGSTQLATELKIESSQTFDKNLRKVKVSKVTMRGTTTTYNFQYDSQKRLKKYWSVGGRYGDTYENYMYGNNLDFTRTKSFKEGDAGIKYIYQKTDYGYLVGGDDTKKKIFAKNNLVNKIVLGYDRNEPSETLISHNENGKVIKRETSFATVTNQYNSNGDLKFFKETIKHSGNTTSRTYAYKYDKYGNWIIQIRLLDMSIAKGIPSFPQPTLREITYSNGEKTGTTDITKVTNELISLRKKVKSVSKNTVNQLMTWKKTTKTKFNFYFSHKESAKITNRYMGNHLLVFDVDDRQLYVLENFANATIYELFTAKKLNINTKNGYWFKTQSGGVSVYTNTGDYIKENTIYEYAPNQIDVLYQGKNQPNKMILKNFKNAQIHKVYPVFSYSSYNENTVVNNNTKKKESSGKCVKGDCENGYGEYQYENGVKADGFFENGKPNGPMHLNNESTNESVFSTYKGDYKTTVGMLYRYYKNRYTDIIDYNKQYGVTNDATNKKTYKLNFKNGKVASKTLMSNNNSESCILGNCVNGSGVYTYKNGTMYFGTFQNGKRHGFGKLDFKGGNLYIGEFQNGNYHGLGTYVWSDYNYYMGEYQNGKYHGKGVMYYNKETFKAGYWENGELVGQTNSVQKTTISNNTNTYNVNKNAIGFNRFSELQKDKILACKNNSECVSDYMNVLYNEERKNSSKNKAIKKTTEYFRSLYSMSPKLAYDTLFKMGLEIIDFKSLPEEMKTDFRKRAKGLADGYNKFKKENGY